MTFRVFYKKFSEMQKALMLVEEDFEADTFTTIDGHLTFYKNEEPIWSLPPAFWADVRRVEETPTTIVP